MKTLTSPLLLFIITLSLVTIGILSVYSASAGRVPARRGAAQFDTARSAELYLAKQLAFAAAGLALMLACYAVDYNLLRRHGLKLMIGALILCALVFVPKIGVSMNGARRWIALGPFKFQPSELAKLALVIYMAKMLADRHQVIRSFFSGVMPAMIVTGVFAAIIVLEPDFGMAFVLCVVIFGMWLAGGMRWFHMLGLCGCAVPAGVLAFLLEPYRVRRVLAFYQYLIAPDKVDKELVRGALFQLLQSLTAVGSGGMWGQHLGEGHQKYFLTEQTTDFIFAIMCEELGFVRIAGIVVLYAMLIILGWVIAWRTTDLFGSLLASGITLMIFTSGAINMGVVLGLLPTKGLVLPFFSAGGSSLLVCMAAMGILMNVARNQYSFPRPGREEG